MSMSTARKPLSSRNAGSKASASSGIKVKQKKQKYPFSIMDRASLVIVLKDLIKDTDVYPHMTISEEDLLNPTADKIQQIYFSCLNFCFEISTDVLKLSSFQENVSDHPELLDDFTYRIHFLRLMNVFMTACLVDDFSLEDLLNPDPKRTTRNLSAIINYIKYHFNVFETDSHYNEAQDTRAAVVQEYAVIKDENEAVKHQLSALQRQRQEEHDSEEELKQELISRAQEIHALQTQQASFEQQYRVVCEQKAACEHQLAELSREFDKSALRNEDLARQVVTSPDKLKAKLFQLQQQAEDVKTVTKESETILTMWESLATKAHNIPQVLKGLNEDLETLMDKNKKSCELTTHLESVEEHVGRQKQLLREATAKHQLHIHHLKVLEGEHNKLAYGEHQMTHFQSTNDLQRDVQSMDQEMKKRQEYDAKLRLETEDKKKRLEEQKLQFERDCTELEDIVTALRESYNTQASQYSEAMERMGIIKWEKMES